MHLSTTTGDPSHEMTLSWVGGGSVSYGTASRNHTETVEASEFDYGKGVRMSVARLDGLQPDTTYYYNLTVDPLERSFRTAPEKGSSQPFTFASVADLGTTTAAIDVMGLITDVDFVVHPGDVSYCASQACLDDFFSNVIGQVADHTMYMPTAGNHEVDDLDEYVSYLGRFALPGREPDVFCNPCAEDSAAELWYSFDWGNVHFVGYNGNVLEGLDALNIGPSHPLYQWLEDDLAAASADPQIDWTVVFAHYSPYVYGRDDSHSSSEGVREAFEDLFETYGVDLFLAGHQHSYQRTLPVADHGDSVDTDSCGPAPFAVCNSPQFPIYVTNGAAGADLYSNVSVCGMPSSANCSLWRGRIITGQFGAVRVFVDGQRLSLQFVSRNGAVLDEALITK